MLHGEGFGLPAQCGPRFVDSIIEELEDGGPPFPGRGQHSVVLPLRQILLGGQGETAVVALQGSGQHHGSGVAGKAIRVIARMGGGTRAGILRHAGISMALSGILQPLR